MFWPVAYPGLYEAKVEKYKGREHLTKRVVPLLSCLWNDVLHRTNIHPREFYLVFKAAGRAPQPDLLWLSVPLDYAISNPTVVYACRTTEENRITPPEYEFSWFDRLKFVYWRFRINCRAFGDRRLFNSRSSSISHRLWNGVVGSVIRWVTAQLIISLSALKNGPVPPLSASKFQFLIYFHAVWCMSKPRFSQFVAKPLRKMK